VVLFVLAVGLVDRVLGPVAVLLVASGMVVTVKVMILLAVPVLVTVLVLGVLDVVGRALVRRSCCQLDDLLVWSFFPQRPAWRQGSLNSISQSLR
jgi:hypothetical protein